MTTAAPENDVIAELNGALTKTGEPVEIEKQEQPASLSEQLEVRPAAKTATPKAAGLDKTFAKKAGGNGYRVIVEGEYYAKSTETKGNVVKPYSLPFNLPALVNGKGDAALGIIVGKLLKPALLKLDPLAVTYRTHAIVSATPLNGAPEPTSLMYASFDALKKYVRENLLDFPVNVDEYVDVNHLREDVIDFKTNAVSDVVLDAGLQSERKVKGGFGVKKTPAERILERHVERKELAELAGMNEGLL